MDGPLCLKITKCKNSLLDGVTVRREASTSELTQMFSKFSKERKTKYIVEDIATLNGFISKDLALMRYPKAMLIVRQCFVKSNPSRIVHYY